MAQRRGTDFHKPTAESSHRLWLRGNERGAHFPAPTAKVVSAIVSCCLWWLSAPTPASAAILEPMFSLNMGRQEHLSPTASLLACRYGCKKFSACRGWVPWSVMLANPRREIPTMGRRMEERALRNTTSSSEFTQIWISRTFAFC